MLFSPIRLSNRSGIGDSSLTLWTVLRYRSALISPFRSKQNSSLLGTNPAGLSAQPFMQWIKRSRELSDLNLQGCRPFHLVASFQWGETAPGSYDVICQDQPS